MKLQISADRSIDLTNIEVINMGLRLVLFSDDAPAVISEDFVDAVRVQIDSLLGGEILQVQRHVYVMKRAVVGVDRKWSMVDLRSGSAEDVAPEYLALALAIHG